MIQYMDDIIIIGKDGKQVLQCFDDLKTALQTAELQIAAEKVQLQDPYIYLGFQINGPHIINNKTTFRTDSLKMFNDFQKLLEDINWLHPYLKLNTGELKLSFDVLKGDADPKSDRALMEEGRKALQRLRVLFLPNL